MCGSTGERRWLLARDVLDRGSCIVGCFHSDGSMVPRALANPTSSIWFDDHSVTSPLRRELRTHHPSSSRLLTVYVPPMSTVPIGAAYVMLPSTLTLSESAAAWTT